MLSSFWDASCTCNIEGEILSSTPHLEQLLGGIKKMVGSSLYAFAANETDSSRLQAFLQQAMSAGTARRASSLQCSVQPLDAGPAATKEVVVYGIKLPPGSTLQN